MKTCYRCKETMPFDCFSKSTKVKSGLQGECKECRNKRQNTEEYKAKHKEYQRDYYERIGMKFGRLIELSITKTLMD